MLRQYAEWSRHGAGDRHAQRVDTRQRRTGAGCFRRDAARRLGAHRRGERAGRLSRQDRLRARRERHGAAGARRTASRRRLSMARGRGRAGRQAVRAWPNADGGLAPAGDPEREDRHHRRQRPDRALHRDGTDRGQHEVRNDLRQHRHARLVSRHGTSIERRRFRDAAHGCVHGVRRHDVRLAAGSGHVAFVRARWRHAADVDRAIGLVHRPARIPDARREAATRSPTSPSTTSCPWT